MVSLVVGVSRNVLVGLIYRMVACVVRRSVLLLRGFGGLLTKRVPVVLLLGFRLLLFGLLGWRYGWLGLAELVHKLVELADFLR